MRPSPVWPRTPHSGYQLVRDWLQRPVSAWCRQEEARVYKDTGLSDRRPEPVEQEVRVEDVRLESDISAIYHLPGSHHHHPRHQVSDGDCVTVLLLTVCPHNCTPRPRTFPTPYRKRKSHVINDMYPPLHIIVTTLTVYVKIPRSLHCLMSNAIHVFILCWSSLFTCVHHVFSSLSLSTTCTNLTINPLLHCNKYHTTNTNNPPRGVSGWSGSCIHTIFCRQSHLLFISAVRARAQPADISLYTASVSSMPRCFMAKKLKYPYQQWKETKLEEDQDDHVAPVAAKSFPGSHHLDCFLRCVD